jgi:hypothetical protein
MHVSNKKGASSSVQRVMKMNTVTSQGKSELEKGWGGLGTCQSAALPFAVKSSYGFVVPSLDDFVLGFRAGTITVPTLPRAYPQY